MLVTFWILGNSNSVRASTGILGPGDFLACEEVSVRQATMARTQATKSNQIKSKWLECATIQCVHNHIYIYSHIEFCMLLTQLVSHYLSHILQLDSMLIKL